MAGERDGKREASRTAVAVSAALPENLGARESNWKKLSRNFLEIPAAPASIGAVSHTVVIQTQSQGTHQSAGRRSMT